MKSVTFRSLFDFFREFAKRLNVPRDCSRPRDCFAEKWPFWRQIMHFSTPDRLILWQKIPVSLCTFPSKPRNMSLFTEICHFSRKCGTFRRKTRESFVDSEPTNCLKPLKWPKYGHFGCFLDKTASKPSGNRACRCLNRYLPEMTVLASPLS